MTRVALAISALQAGGIVCFPTESSYGLAVDPRDSEALARLAALKGRAATAPFALIAGSRAQASACTDGWPNAASALANKYWPGPLTMILPPSSDLGAQCIGPSGGVGVRISSLQLARDLAIGLGYAITATSANPSGEPAAESIAQARGYFGSGVAVYLDGGPCADEPSTLIDFDAVGQAQVLRQGPIVLLPADAP